MCPVISIGEVVTNGHMNAFQPLPFGFGFSAFPVTSKGVCGGVISISLVRFCRLCMCCGFFTYRSALIALPALWK